MLRYLILLAILVAGLYGSYYFSYVNLDYEFLSYISSYGLIVFAVLIFIWGIVVFIKVTLYAHDSSSLKSYGSMYDKHTGEID